MAATSNPRINIAVIGAGIYLAILFILTKVFDWQSYLLYIGVSIVMAFIFIKGKPDAKESFIAGAAIPIVYNYGGQFLGWFTADLTTVLSGAALQGIVFFLVSAMGGRK